MCRVGPELGGFEGSNAGDVDGAATELVWPAARVCERVSAGVPDADRGRIEERKTLSHLGDLGIGSSVRDYRGHHVVDLTEPGRGPSNGSANAAPNLAPRVSLSDDSPPNYTTARSSWTPSRLRHLHPTRDYSDSSY
jgi:hypothetical protein